MYRKSLKILDIPKCLVVQKIYKNREKQKTEN